MKPSALAINYTLSAVDTFANRPHRISFQPQRQQRRPPNFFHRRLFDNGISLNMWSVNSISNANLWLPGGNQERQELKPYA